jgi:hypothetical protein
MAPRRNFQSDALVSAIKLYGRGCKLPRRILRYEILGRAKEAKFKITPHCLPLGLNEQKLLNSQAQANFQPMYFSESHEGGLSCWDTYCV